ncbi:MAG: hypothetical protein KGH89_00480 [Thaumarchaeota archaeon]|nr:hypothetical protein [Nitrososphaerota archaeon]MDE1867955.1 hypothetical protein [Nitrososphaerota archaeon]
MNKQKITIVALSVALFVSAQYIIYEKITESRQQELANAYQGGYKNGLTDAAVAVYKQTENCQTTTVTIGNLTKTIFDVSCLKAEKNMTR